MCVKIAFKNSLIIKNTVCTLYIYYANNTFSVNYEQFDENLFYLHNLLDTN